MATDSHPLPTEDEVLTYFDRCSNWGRWGKDDQLGALNLITPEKRKQAIDQLIPCTAPPCPPAASAACCAPSIAA